jgi:4-amino-4-deoxy-L-arabinose transferase-like glycosyltransferase
VSYLVSHTVWFLVLAAVLYLPGFALGTELTRRGLPASDASTRAILGIAVWVYLLFFFSVAQTLTFSAILVAIAAALIGSGLVWIHAGRPLPRWRAPRPAADDVGTWILVISIAAVLVASFVLGLRPAIAWDADTYHLTVPRLYIEHGGFREIPFLVYSNWPMATEMVFLLAMNFAGPVLANVVQIGFGLLIALLLVRLFRNSGGALPAALATSLFLAHPVVLWELPIAYVDIAYASFALAAFVFVQSSFEEAGRGGFHLVMAGLACGLAAAAKPFGITVLFCVLPLVLWRERRGSLAGALRAGLRVAVPCMALLVPWLVKSWAYTSNPFYPFLYQVFDGRYWSADLGREALNSQLAAGMGRHPFDYLLLPVRVMLLGGPGNEHFDGRLNPIWIVLLPLTIIVGWRRPLVRRALGMAGLFFAAWSLSGQQMRYLIPVLPLLSIAVAAVGLDMVERFKEPGTAALARGLLGGTASALLLIVALPTLMSAAPATVLLLERGQALEEEMAPEVFRAMDRLTPPDARVLFLNYNGGFFCPREYVADSLFEASQVRRLLEPGRNVEEIAAALARERITHILVFKKDWGIVWPPALSEFMTDPGRARVLYERPGDPFVLIELRAGAGS